MTKSWKKKKKTLHTPAMYIENSRRQGGRFPWPLNQQGHFPMLSKDFPCRSELPSSLGGLSTLSAQSRAIAPG